MHKAPFTPLLNFTELQGPHYVRLPAGHTDSVIMMGDCLAHLKNVQSRSVDLVVADLPYGTPSAVYRCGL